MTLLIACILIHMSNLSAWWYPITFVIWAAHLAAHESDSSKK